jgi:hypothetical protein
MRETTLRRVKNSVSIKITIAGRPLSNLPSLAYNNLRYLVGHVAEWTGDHRYHIDTRTSLRGYESLAALKTIGDKGDAIPYTPTPFATIKSVLAHLPQDVSNYTFVDYGSGRGRMILLASVRKFRKVIGIEFAETLHHAAELNIQRFRGRRSSPVKSLLCRAEEFEIPGGPCILYLFNPFEATIMNRVAHQVASSYRANPRHIIVLYYNPTVHRAFEAENVFQITKTIRENLLSGLLHLHRYTVRILEAG